MPFISPTTLTQAEQNLILRATAKNLRDHLIISMALGTGLRLGEIVGLNVGDVFAPDGAPKTRGGEKFLFKTVPDLIKAIERLADALERVVAERQRGQREKDDADA